MSSELVPAALIDQLNISLRQDSSISIPQLLTIPSPATFSIEEAIASQFPSLDPSFCCPRCRGGLLCGRDSPFCIYCGEEFKRGEDASNEISFRNTVACNWLLGSLGLDASEAMTSISESTPKTGTRLLSDILSLKLAFSLNETIRTKNNVNNEPNSTSYALKLSGLDLDSIFKGTEKSIPSSKVPPGTNNQIITRTKGSTINTVKIESNHSFAKWDADFQPDLPSGVQNGLLDPTNKTEPGSVNKIEPSATIEKSSTDNDDFGDWNRFTGSVESQNGLSDPINTIEPGSLNKIEPSDTIEKSSINNDDFGDWNRFTGSVESQNGLSDPTNKTEPDSLNKIEPSEAIEKSSIDDDDFGDWNRFTGSVEPQNGLSDPTNKTKPDSLNKIEPSEAIEKSSIDEDDFGDWNKFTESVESQNGLLDPTDKTKPASIDPLSLNSNPEPFDIIEKSSTVDNDDFGDWNNFTGPVESQIGLTGLEENNRHNSSDSLPVKDKNPSDSLDPLNSEFVDWNDFSESVITDPVEKTIPGSVDPFLIHQVDSLDPFLMKTVDSLDPFLIKQVDSFDPFLTQSELPITSTIPFDNSEKSIISGNDILDDWGDFNGPNGLTGLDENTVPSLIDPLNTNKPSHGTEALNAEFGDWEHLTLSSVVQIEPVKKNPVQIKCSEPSDDLFDEWEEYKEELDETNNEVINGTTDPNDKYLGSEDLLTTRPNDDWQGFMSSSQTPVPSNTDSLEGRKMNGMGEYLSQMKDLSFMLKDDLSVPDKFDAK